MRPQLAWFVVLLNRIAERGAKWIALPMAIYASVFLMIVLRGSLMIAMGFAAAALLSFLFAYALLSVRWGARRQVRQAAARRPWLGAMTRYVSFVGPLPPPVNGFSSVCAMMLECIRTKMQVDVFDRAPSMRARIFGVLRQLRAPGEISGDLRCAPRRGAIRGAFRRPRSVARFGIPAHWQAVSPAGSICTTIALCTSIRPRG